MIVADRPGVGPDDVEVLHSDTAVAPYGTDTYGSRSVSVGGTAIASTRAVANAVVDALSHLGVTTVEMPITPERVWRAIGSARQGAGAGGAR